MLISSPISLDTILVLLLVSSHRNEITWRAITTGAGCHGAIGRHVLRSGRMRREADAARDGLLSAGQDR